MNINVIEYQIIRRDMLIMNVSRLFDSYFDV